MKINREEMTKALALAKPGLSNNQSISQSNTFIFKDDNVWTFNDEVAVCVPLETGIKCSIPAKELLAFVGRAKADELNIKFEKNQFKATASRIRCGINSESDIDLPIGDLEIPDDDNWVELPKRFIEGVLMVAGSTGRDSGRLSIECIHITSEGFLEACDNYQATRFDLQEEFDGDNTLIPARNIVQLQSFGPTHYAVTKDWLWFINEDDAMYAVRSVWGDFEPIEEHMEADGPKVQFPKDLKQALGDANIFVDDNSEQNVSVTLKKGKILVKGQGDMGWLEEEVPIEYNGKSVSFQINPSFLLRMIGTMNDAIIGEAAVVFSEEDCSHAISIEV